MFWALLKSDEFYCSGSQEYLKEGVCNLSIDEAVQVGTYRN